MKRIKDATAKRIEENNRIKWNIRIKGNKRIKENGLTR